MNRLKYPDSLTELSLDDPYRQLVETPGAGLELSAKRPHLSVFVDPANEREVSRKVTALAEFWTEGVDLGDISVTETSERHIRAEKLITPLGCITAAYATIGAGKPELVSVIVRPSTLLGD